MNTVDWKIIDESAMDSVILRADPISRLIPDGCRVQVSVYHDERSFHDSSRPIGERNVTEQYRVASVQLVDANDLRDKESAAVRFGSTMASGTCWARVEESQMHYRDGAYLDAPIDYWRCTSTTAWRLEGFADDLPAGAAKAVREVFSSAAEFVGNNLPHLWAGAEERRARRRVADAESAVAKAKAELKTARADLRKAERVHERATSKAGA